MKEIYIDSNNGITSEALLGALLEIGADKDKIESILSPMVSNIKINVSQGILDEERFTSAIIEYNYLTSNEDNLRLRDVIQFLDITLIDDEDKKYIKNMMLHIQKSKFKADNLEYSGDLMNIGYKDILKDMLYLSAILCALKTIGCSNVYINSIYIGGKLKREILNILSDKKLILSSDKHFYYDRVSAVFLALYCHNVSNSEINISSMGFGKKENNTVRVYCSKERHDYERDVQYVVECNIDDMNPEGYGFIMEKILKAGALDVYLTPIIMKKGRPAIKINILCDEGNLDVIGETIFRETSTFGIRSYKVDKTMLKRTFETVDTDYGRVKIKYGWVNGKILKGKPEYDDCKNISVEKSLPLNQVYFEAIRHIKSK